MLHLAVLTNQIESLEYLLSQKNCTDRVQIARKNQEGYSPLGLAEKMNSKSCIKLLKNQENTQYSPKVSNNNVL